jgi:hypothetical protein
MNERLTGFSLSSDRQAVRACRLGTLNSDNDAMGEERRLAPRTRSFLQGRIFFNNRRSSVDCLIRDYSDAGAKLKFSEAVTVPEAFELYVPNKESVHRCRVQWRSGGEMGVSFNAETESPSIAPAMPAASDLAARVARLESEHAALRRAINELRAEIRKQHGEVG